MQICSRAYRDIQEEEQHAAEELADVLRQLAHHAGGFLSCLTQAHQELCSQLPDALGKLWRLRNLHTINQWSDTCETSLWQLIL